MAVNRGKQFEDTIRASVEKVPNVSIDRLHDQLSGRKGSTNICDYILYKKPYEYYIECKSIHGNRLSIHSNDPKHKYGNITNRQWEGLLEKSKINGVFAGIICWWVDKDITAFISIEALEYLRNVEYQKSISYEDDWVNHVQPEYLWIPLKGKKKRVFFNYDMEEFFHDIEKTKRRQ